MAVAQSTGQNLPPPQSAFVSSSGVLSNDGYQFLMNLINRAANAIPTAQIDQYTAAGLTQATATPITTQWADVNAVSGGGTGVMLLSLEEGQAGTVFNFSGGAIDIYPPVGFAINALAVNAPFSLANNGRASFYFVSESQITT